MKKETIAPQEPNQLESRIGVLALDQSTVAIGHSTWVGGELEHYGLFEPDYPRLDKTRAFIRDYCNSFAYEGWLPVVVCEDIYYRKNVVTYRALAILMGHIQAAAYDCGALFELVTANEALYALTGIRASPRNPVPRAKKKPIVIEAVRQRLGVVLDENIADSISIGLAYHQRHGISITTDRLP